MFNTETFVMFKGFFFEAVSVSTTPKGLDLHFVPDRSVQKLLIDFNVRLVVWTDFTERADVIAGCRRKRKAAQQNVL